MPPPPRYPNTGIPHAPIPPPPPLAQRMILRLFRISFVYGKQFFDKIHTFFYVEAEVLLPKCAYGPWDHVMVSTSKLIYLEKRYQQNPQGGFPTFQVTL